MCWVVYVENILSTHNSIDCSKGGISEWLASSTCQRTEGSPVSSDTSTAVR